MLFRNADAVRLAIVVSPVVLLLLLGAWPGRCLSLPAYNQAWREDCCRNYTTTAACLQACYQVLPLLPSNSSQALTIAMMNPHCSFKSAKDPVWFCILIAPTQSMPALPTPQPTSSPANLTRLSISSTGCSPTNCTQTRSISERWCCSQATSEECRRPCDAIVSGVYYQTDVVLLDRCHKLESERPMSICLQQIKTPAWPSCSGLRYCSNFNRPLLQFGNCSLTADVASARQYASWQREGYISLWNLRIPVNVNKCGTRSLWKALSCMTNISPTNSRFDRRMCVSSCKRILRNCQYSSGSLDESACYAAHPEFLSNSSDCIPLEKFLDPPDVPSTASLASMVNPCSPNPCGNQQCLVNHDCLIAGHCSINYTCLPGCAVNRAGVFVGDGEWVHVFPASSNLTAAGDAVSRQYCACDGATGRFSRCTTVTHRTGQPCGTIADGKVYTRSDGTPCLCDAGSISCTLNFSAVAERGHAQQVNMLLYPPESVWSSSSCRHCSRNLDPVCGGDGRTYINECLAMCSYVTSLATTGRVQSSGGGIQLLNTTSLISKPGHGISCTGTQQPTPTATSASQRCIPQPGRCLAAWQDCSQHRCEADVCPSFSPAVPFCDSCTVQHATACTLRKCLKVSPHSPPSCTDNCQWAYAGRCRKGCSGYDPVCGVDGQTYDSQCALQALAVPMDYFGPCKHMTLAGGLVFNCTSVVCPKLPPFCNPLPRLPGTCCPVCGSFLSILVSSVAGEAFSLASNPAVQSGAITPNVSLQSLRVSEILMHLQQLRSLPSCRVYGYLLWHTLTVVMHTDYLTENITRSQVESCTSQARTLNGIINTEQAALKTRPPLSVLLVSTATSSTLKPPAVPSASVAVVNMASTRAALFGVLLSLILPYVFLPT